MFKSFEKKKYFLSKYEKRLLLGKVVSKLCAKVILKKRTRTFDKSAYSLR